MKGFLFLLLILAELCMADKVKPYAINTNISCYTITSVMLMGRAADSGSPDQVKHVGKVDFIDGDLPKWLETWKDKGGINGFLKEKSASNAKPDFRILYMGKEKAILDVRTAIELTLIFSDPENPFLAYVEPVPSGNFNMWKYFPSRESIISKNIPKKTAPYLQNFTNTSNLLILQKAYVREEPGDFYIGTSFYGCIEDKYPN